MALTQIADIVEPSVFEPYLRLRTAELSALWEGGLVRTDPRLDALMDGAGTLFEMPAWDDLPDTEASIGTDTTGTITPDKIGTVKDQAVRHFRNHAWSAADILVSFVGEDPMQEIANKVAAYWARQYQSMLIQSQKGVLADNVANDSSDMLHDIATDDAAAITAAEKVSADAILQASQTAGDAAGMFSVLSMHSVISTELKRQNLIDFIPNSRGEVSFGRYLDKLVLIDDGHPAVMGSNRITYDTYMYRPGAFGFGRGNPKIPVEVDREPLQGVGSGLENLISRQVVALHPRGVKFTESSVAGNSPTNTELADAANWDRVYPERKQVALAYLQTNG